MIKTCGKLPIESSQRDQQPAYRLSCRAKADGDQQVELLIAGEKPVVMDGVEGLPLAADSTIFDPATLSVRLLPGQPNLYWIRYEHRRTQEPGSASALHRHDRVIRVGDSEHTVFDRWSMPEYGFSRLNVSWDIADTLDLSYQGSTLRVVETRYSQKVWEGLGLSMDEDCRGECDCLENSEDVGKCPNQACYRACLGKRLATDNSEVGVEKTVTTLDVATAKTISRQVFWEKEFYPLSGGPASFLVLDDGVSGWMFVRDNTAPTAANDVRKFSLAALDPEHSVPIPASATCWLYNRIPWDPANAARNHPPAPTERIRPEHFKPVDCCALATSADGKATTVYESTPGGHSPLRPLAVYESGATSCHSQNLAVDAPPWGQAAPDNDLLRKAASAERANSSEKIITLGSGVRLRPDPDTNSLPLTRLSTGTVLEKMYLGSEPSTTALTIPAGWYLALGPNERFGWISAEQTAPFDSGNPWPAYRAVLDRRLTASGPRTLPEDLDFLMFLAGILVELPKAYEERSAIEYAAGIKQSLERLEAQLCKAGGASGIDPDPLLNKLAALDQAVAAQASKASEEARSALGMLKDDVRKCAKIDNWSLMAEERLGGLRLGLAEPEIRKAVPCEAKRGPDQEWGADGKYHQRWAYSDCGVVLDMASERKGGPKSIESIEVTTPSELKTLRGIGIGSSEKEAVEAYGRYQNLDTYISEREKKNNERKKGDDLVADSEYGGLFFSFKNGRVSRIFLGATAE